MDYCTKYASSVNSFIPHLHLENIVFYQKKYLQKSLNQFFDQFTLSQNHRLASIVALRNPFFCVAFRKSKCFVEVCACVEILPAQETPAFHSRFCFCPIDSVKAFIAFS